MLDEKLPACHDQIRIPAKRLQTLNRFEHHGFMPRVVWMSRNEPITDSNQTEQSGIAVVKVRQFDHDVCRFRGGVIVFAKFCFQLRCLLADFIKRRLCSGDARDRDCNAHQEQGRQAVSELHFVLT